MSIKVIGKKEKTRSSRAVAYVWTAIQIVIWAGPALIMWLSPYRFVIAMVQRIGHLAVEVDYFLKNRALGAYPNVRPILFNKRHRVSNPTLLRIWGDHMTVVTNRVAYDFLRPLQRFPWLCIDLADVVIRTEKTAQYQQIVELWGERSPIFRLPGEILDKGQQILRGWGIPEGAWFVPVHARDSIYSPSDEYVHRYRNCDIANFSKAVDAIIARGGWCIRMGEKGTPSLSEREGLVNYPDTPFKSDWMDLFLCNQARFFLGNTSGLKLVATISGVPCAAANIAPYEAIYGFLPSDISIPKLLRFKDGTTPRFEEIFDSDLSKCHWAWRFEEAGITFIENTPEEIAELASEMLDVLDRNPHRTPEDEALQHAFRALMKPWHYTFGTRSRIGKVFLRDNAHLI